MSPERVEIVRQVFAITDVAVASERWHPEIEWIVAKEHPEARALKGPGAVIAYLEEWQAALKDASLEMDSFVDAGDRVVACDTVRGTGTGSGVDVRVPIAFVCTLVDGKLVRVEEFLDPSEALRAVGRDG